MTILWSNNASTTVSGSISAASTTVQLAAGTGVLFPNPTGGDYFCATFYDQATKTQNEIVHCTARSGDIVTIVRAQEGTVAQAWNAGDIFANLVTAGTLRAFVQTGAAPAANTTIVYVGDDTSTTPNLVICTTTPVPSALALGMQFNIRIKNNNTSAVNVQLNGGTSMSATRQNGAALSQGDLTATEEMIFVYNGVNLTAMVSNVMGPTGVGAPPVTTFYVRTDGNDNNTGFANTPTDAFATLYGAVNKIRSRYISQNQITIRVADGTYIGGAGVQGGYISSWNIIGNSANPGNVVIDATSGSPPAGSRGGVCIDAESGGIVTMTGFTFRSYYSNAASGGATLWLVNCNFNGTLAGNPATIYTYQAGTLVLQGTFTYTQGGANQNAIFLSAYGSYLSLGYHDVYGTRSVSFNIVGSPVVITGTLVAANNGVIGYDSTTVSWPGGIPVGYKYYCQTAGGISTYAGNLSGIPGTQPGIVQSPGWVN